eukprot:TRINITY_DN42343_c0_g1_i1.p1 TRINITY_DN42343_c0_g1~~TRINITY_DN42343_c0_g1_i1.p1  ORF type:complete len:1050 (+),score=226.44 TRINITY_DN42343_c0_g1_i1:117-3266(+)
MVEVLVNSADNLPHNPYVSVRLGDVRRQQQYCPGMKVCFECPEPAPRSFTVDLFEKVGSVQVSLAEMMSVGDCSKMERSVQIVRADGETSSLQLSVATHGTSGALSGNANLAMTDQSEAKRDRRKHAAVKAQSYLDDHAVSKILTNMVHTLLRQRPANPFAYMMTYLQGYMENGVEPMAASAPLPKEIIQAPPTKPAASQKTMPAAQAAQAPKVPAPQSQLEIDRRPSTPSASRWAERPGMGASDAPGFPADGSGALPPLDKHCNLLAQLLREDPALYHSLNKLVTPLGVTLARCIKPAIDEPGLKGMPSVGIVAGDDTCYSVFRNVFDPIIAQWHVDHLPTAMHPTKLEPKEVDSRQIDAGGRMLRGITMKLSRNVAHMCMPTACSAEQRREVERLVTKALLSTTDRDLQGTYRPLRGSMSYIPLEGGMTKDEQVALKKRGWYPEEPNRPALLAAGYARHWPDARGIFTTDEDGVVVLVNYLDHLQMEVTQADCDFRGAFSRLTRLEKAVNAVLKSCGKQYARNAHLGFLSSCPTRLGNALVIEAALDIPMVGSHSDFQHFLDALGLMSHLSSRSGSEELWIISCTGTLGTSEAEQIHGFMASCESILELEQRMQGGEEIDHLVHFEEEAAEEGPPMVRVDTWHGEAGGTEGLGDLETPGLCLDPCPEELPDLSEHHSMMADAFKADAGLYDRLRGQRTELGCTLAHCIKTGIDHEGHSLVRTLGLVAADAFCYDAYRDLFDAVLQDRLGMPNGLPSHPASSAMAPIDAAVVDPSGECLLSAQLTVSRNFMRLRMLPAISLEERQEVERLLVSAFVRENVCGTGGSYYPLKGSMSCPLRLGGMSDEETAALEKAGFSFQTPDAEVHLAAGYGRHWPDSRGIYTTECRKVAVWVNEEDHFRLAISAGRDAELPSMYERLRRLLEGIEASSKKRGHTFAHSSRLGYLGSSPANIGSCLSCTLTLAVPKLSRMPGFRPLCDRLSVVSRPAAGRPLGAGFLDVSNAVRFGSTDSHQINQVVGACRLMIQLEKRLQSGEKIVLEDCNVLVIPG